MKKISRAILRVLNYVVIAAVLLSYLAPFVNPNISWIIAFLGLSFKAWVFALLILLVLGLLLKTKMLVKNGIVLAIGIPFLLRIFSIHGTPTETGNLKLASFNTYAIGQHRNLNTSKDIESYFQLNDIDCAALIEWRFREGNISKKAFPYRVKIRTTKLSNNGILLVSKYPIKSSGMVPFSNSSYNMAGFMDIEVNDRLVRVYGIHLETTRIKSRDYHSLKHMEFDSVYTENAKSVVARLKTAMQIRESQVQDIVTHMKDCPHPSIVIGDFNDTPQSYTYQQLKSGKTDAFVTAGRGFDATFLKPFPFLRIDFILLDNQLTATEYHSTDSIYSDHKLIFANIKL